MKAYFVHRCYHLLAFGLLLAGCGKISDLGITLPGAKDNSDSSVLLPSPSPTPSDSPSDTPSPSPSPTVVLENPAVGSHLIFVSPDGDDASVDPSDSHLPLRTLAAASSLASAGDLVYVREGVYRETLLPARSGLANKPIRFVAYPGENPVLSGADVVSGWTLDSTVGGVNIYRANPGFAVKQLFIDGRLKGQARYPDAVNPNPMLLQRLMKVSVSATAAPGTGLYAVTGEGLDQPTNFWVGATLWGYFDSTGRSVSAAGKVVASEPGTLWMSNLSATRLWASGDGDAYLVGTKSALNLAGEWAFENNQLYLGGDATGVVEAKRRDLAIDLRNRSYIEIKGLAVKAATANLDGGHHIVLDGVNFAYVAHDIFVRGGWNHDLALTSASEGTGVLIGGHDNVLRNCEVAFSAGDGITVYGQDNLVENCTVHDVNYRGTDSALVSVEGTRQTVRRNTLYNAIRSGIVHRNLTASHLIQNHVYNVGVYSSDLGLTYSHLIDAQGTELAYNWLHHNFSGGDRYDTLGNGIYLDANAQDFVVHHNVVWNCPHSSLVFISGSTRDALFYNNTLWSNWRGFTGGVANSNIVLTNNVSNVAIEAVGTLTNNVVASTLPVQDVWSASFWPTLTSPFIDAGLAINGITDGFLGAAPDQGAYESGTPAWVPGALPSAGNRPPVVSLVSPRRSRSIPSTSTTLLKAQAFDPDGSIARVEFYANDQKIGEGTLNAHLWELPLYSLSTGSYAFYARAYDSSGAFSDSNAVSTQIGPRDAFHDIWAEALDAQQGVVTDGWSGVTNIDNGDWVLYRQIDFQNAGVSLFKLRIALPPEQAGRTVSVRLDDLNGTEIASLTTVSTGGWGSPAWLQTSVTGSVSGVHDVYLRFSGGNGVGNMDVFRFVP